MVNDVGMIEITFLQNQLGVLQKKLEIAKHRENELNILLQKEIQLKKVYAKIDNENVRLRSETENQKWRPLESVKKDKEFSGKLKSVTGFQGSERNLSRRKKT